MQAYSALLSLQIFAIILNISYLYLWVNIINLTIREYSCFAITQTLRYKFRRNIYEFKNDIDWKYMIICKDISKFHLMKEKSQESGNPKP